MFPHRLPLKIIRIFPLTLRKFFTAEAQLLSFYQNPQAIFCPPRPREGRLILKAGPSLAAGEIRIQIVGKDPGSEGTLPAEIFAAVPGSDAFRHHKLDAVQGYIGAVRALSGRDFKDLHAPVVFLPLRVGFRQDHRHCQCLVGAYIPDRSLNLHNPSQTA